MIINGLLALGGSLYLLFQLFCSGGQNNETVNEDPYRQTTKVNYDTTCRLSMKLPQLVLQPLNSNHCVDAAQYPRLAPVVRARES